VSLRKLGLGLYLAGGAILLHAGVTIARGYVARDAARVAWEAAEARRAVAKLRAGLSGMALSASASRGTPVARLLIPRLGFDEVVVEGVGTDALNAGPGHLPGTPLPGADGNAVFSAHRDRHFASLDQVQIGDTIRTETSQYSAVWVVAERKIKKESEPALFASREPQLTLTTCWPVRYLGPAPERLLLTAVLVSREPRG
jgi:sortase A